MKVKSQGDQLFWSLKFSDVIWKPAIVTNGKHPLVFTAICGIRLIVIQINTSINLGHGFKKANTLILRFRLFFVSPPCYSKPKNLFGEPVCRLRENRYLQALRNTVGLNSFLGLFALYKHFFGLRNQTNAKLVGRFFYNLAKFVSNTFLLESFFSQITFHNIVIPLPKASSSAQLKLPSLSPTFLVLSCTMLRYVPLCRVMMWIIYEIIHIFELRL